MYDITPINDTTKYVYLSEYYNYINKLMGGVACHLKVT